MKLQPTRHEDNLTELGELLTKFEHLNKNNNLITLIESTPTRMNIITGKSRSNNRTTLVQSAYRGSIDDAKKVLKKSTKDDINAQEPCGRIKRSGSI